MAPVWCLLFLIITNSLFAWLDVQVMHYEFSVSPYFNDRSFQNVVHNVVVQESWHGLLLLAQVIVYWFLRKRTIRKELVWLHIGSLAIAYCILPALIYWFTQMRLMGQIEGDIMQMLFKANRWLSRIAIVVAEVFFLLLLVKIFLSHKKGVSGAVVSDPVSAAAVTADSSAFAGTRHNRHGVATEIPKVFVGPVWCLGVLLIVVTYMLETMLIFWYQIGHDPQYQGIDPTLVLPDVFRFLTMAIILLAECFFYYHFRQHMQQKWPAWTHIALLFVGWMLFPAVFYLSRPQVSRDTGMLILNSVKWVCTIMAHVYFFIALKKASRNGKEAALIFKRAL